MQDKHRKVNRSIEPLSFIDWLLPKKLFENGSFNIQTLSILLCTKAKIQLELEAINENMILLTDLMLHISKIDFKITENYDCQ